MSWSTKYIGLSACEHHCWSLLRRVYADELGIELPAYGGSVQCASERAEVERLVQGEERNGVWTRIEPPLPAPFDVLVFRRGGYRSHVGVAVDARHMLHMDGQARLARLDDPKWTRGLVGVYRHLNCAREAGS
ncbi:MAG: NlpC/P60 family protein [Pseudomonadota bacterium]